MIEYEPRQQYSGPVGVDTITYEVILDKDYTVGEFIDEIAHQRPEDYGLFWVPYTANGETKNKILADYEYGKIFKGPLPKDYYGKKIKRVTSEGVIESNGMDYWLYLEEE